MRFMLPLAVVLASVSPLAAETTVFVVRHAEKVDDGTRDPALSEAGVARAGALAERLAGENVSVIFTTDYERTRATARPLAEKLGLEITSYDPVDFSGLATRVREIDGAVLIVGHSNTVIPIVQALGGAAEGELTDSEYGRIYRLDLGDEVTTELIED